MSALVARPLALRHGAEAIVAGTPASLARHRTFHTLDALRGVAAVAVVLFHVGYLYGITPPAEGQIAVDLFFVMSGFIIAQRYDGDLRAGLGVPRFIAIRLIRLYPLCLLGAALGVVPALVTLAVGDGSPFYRAMAASFPLALAGLPSRLALPTLRTLYPLNYVTWSLALEIVVNVAYAASIRFWTPRRLVVLVSSSFVGLCVAARVFGTLDVGFDWSNAWGGVPRVLFGFGAGVLIQRVHAIRPIGRILPWWTAVLLASLIFFVDVGSPARGLAWLRPAWEVVAVAGLVPFIVVVAIGAEPPAVLRGGCAVAGVFSYLVYSLHAPFVGLYLRGEERLGYDTATSSPGRAVAFTAMLVGLCYLAHVAYDLPIRRVLTGLRTRRRQVLAKN